MPVALTVRVGEEAAKLTIAPKTGSGAESAVESGKTQYVIDSGEATVEVSPDQLSATIRSEFVGEVTGHVIGDADLSEGEQTIQDTFVINFVAPQAADLGLTGEVVPA